MLSIEYIHKRTRLFRVGSIGDLTYIHRSNLIRASLFPNLPFQLH